MQLDTTSRSQEGIDDSKTQHAHVNENDESVALGHHFQANGLSGTAYAKMEPDIKSGDMNANILGKCSDDELRTIADSYNFTVLQRIAFIKAAKLLLREKSGVEYNHDNANINYNNDQLQDLVSKQDESKTWQEINQLKAALHSCP